MVEGGTHNDLVETEDHAGTVWTETHVDLSSRKVLPLETDQLDRSGHAYANDDYGGSD